MQLEPEEAALLTTLVGQLENVMRGERADDPALQRLLPDGYSDAGDDSSDEAAQDFRRFTHTDLLERKRTDAAVLLGTLDGTQLLSPEQAESWLRCLNDVRLVLAQRLGITRDGQAEELYESTQDDDVRGLLAVLAHLALLQELIIEALD
jgi:hypothetical protein